VLFTEGRFFVLYAVVFGLYWASDDDRFRKRLLLIAGYVFYGALDARFLLLLWATTALDYAAGLLLEGARSEDRRRAVVGVAVAANLGILGIFKYYDFFVGSAVDALALVGVTASPPLLHLVLPAGISFYTFQSMSYTIDVYRGMRAERDPVDYALYVGFFPQLVAGPIVRAADFLPQLRAARLWSDVDVRAGLVLVWVGFCKKAVVADNLAPVVDAYFAAPHAYTAGSAWTALLCYGVQLYGDFSGYSDMALGTAALLGYRLRENFRAPALATSPLDYWRRWHMSFSTWLRDYVYTPLGADRGTPLRTSVNVFVTLLLSGLWHGAGWQYVVFGGLHGAAILAERAWRKSAWRGRVPSVARSVVGWAYTQVFFLLLRALFRAPGLAASGPVLAACVFGASAGTAVLPAWSMLVWVGMVVSQAVGQRGWAERGWRAAPPVVFAGVYGLAWAAALALRAIEYRPFVYFSF